MIKKLIVILIIGMIILTGCEDGPNNTPKRRAQDELLRELRYCDTKFGSNDNSLKMEKNVAYCGNVLILLEDLIREGYFEGDDKTEMVIKEKRDVDMARPVDDSEELQDALNDVDRLKSEIIGEI